MSRVLERTRGPLLVAAVAWVSLTVPVIGQETCEPDGDAGCWTDEVRISQLVALTGEAVLRAELATPVLDAARCGRRDTANAVHLLLGQPAVGAETESLADAFSMATIGAYTVRLFLDQGACSAIELPCDSGAAPSACPSAPIARGIRLLPREPAPTVADGPIADPGLDRTVECSGDLSSEVTLDGTASSDPDDRPLTFSWSADGIVFDDPSSPTPTATFPQGTTIVTLVVTNPAGESDGATVWITVEDTVPPELIVPPDRRVPFASLTGTPVDIGQAAATDACCGDDVSIVHDAPAVFPLGMTLVTWTARDCNDLVSIGTQTVEVVDPVFLSTRELQFGPGVGTLRHERVYAGDETAPIRDVIDGFLDAHLGLDALDVQRIDTLLFSVRSSGGMHHPGGFSVLDNANVYEWHAGTGVISTALDWSDHGLDPGSLDAIDRLGDGSFAFSVAERRGVVRDGVVATLEPENVYVFAPSTGQLTTLLDGKALGWSNVDAVDVLDAGRVAFSLSEDRFFGGTTLRHRHVYVWDPATGELGVEFDADAATLDSLDAASIVATEEEPLARKHGQRVGERPSTGIGERKRRRTPGRAGGRR